MCLQMSIKAFMESDELNLIFLKWVYICVEGSYI